MKEILHLEYKELGKDSSPRQHHGIPRGGVSLVDDPQRGRVGHFDGTGYIDVALPPFTQGTFRIESWFNTESLPRLPYGDYRNIALQSSSFDMGIFRDGAGRHPATDDYYLGFGLSRASGLGGIHRHTFWYKPPLNTWIHFAVEMELIELGPENGKHKTLYTFYVDKEKVTKFGDKWLPGLMGLPVRIGQNWRGMLDDTRISVPTGWDWVWPAAALGGILVGCAVGHKVLT